MECVACGHSKDSNELVKSSMPEWEDICIDCYEKQT